MEIYIDLQSKFSDVLAGYGKCGIVFLLLGCACVNYACHCMSKNRRKLKMVIFRLLTALWFGVRMLCNGVRLLIWDVQHYNWCAIDFIHIYMRVGVCIYIYIYGWLYISWHWIASVRGLTRKELMKECFWKQVDRAIPLRAGRVLAVLPCEFAATLSLGSCFGLWMPAQSYLNNTWSKWISR